MARKTRILSVSCAVGFFLATGCAEERASPSSPFEGFYEVTGETVNESGCSTGGTAVTPEAPFFRMEIDVFFGSTYLQRIPCNAPDDCEEWSYSLWKHDGEWISTAGFLSYDPAGCDISAASLERLTGDPQGSIALTTKVLNGILDIAESECNVDEFRNLLLTHEDDLACVRLEVLQAQRFEE